MEKIPSVEDILECKRMWEKELEEMERQGRFTVVKEEKAVHTMKRAMTEPLIRNSTTESLTNVWKLCKKLDEYSHCPVTKPDYARMKKYAMDEPLIKTVLAALKESYYPFEGQVLPDIMGYYYCIALISQSSCERADCITYLNELVDYFVKIEPATYDVLLRNMVVLKKEYTDLEPLYQILRDKQVRSI